MKRKKKPDSKESGSGSGARESSKEDSDLESCDDFCARREREKQREQDEQKACEQRGGKGKGRHFRPGLVALLGKHGRKHHGRRSKEGRGTSNRQRESDCGCDMVIKLLVN